MPAAFLLLALVVLSIVSARAETLSPVITEYEALVDAKQGVVDSCGLHFAVVTSNALAVQGSINLWHFPGKGSGVSLKIVAHRAQSGQLSQVPLAYGWLRTARYNSTRSFVKVPTETPGAFFAGSREPAALDLLGDLLDGGGILGITLEGGGSDDTIRLRPVAEEQALKELMNCTDELRAGMAK